MGGTRLPGEERIGFSSATCKLEMFGYEPEIEAGNSGLRWVTHPQL